MGITTDQLREQILAIDIVLEDNDRSMYAIVNREGRIVPMGNVRIYKTSGSATVALRNAIRSQLRCKLWQAFEPFPYPWNDNSMLHDWNVVYTEFSRAWDLLEAEMPELLVESCIQQLGYRVVSLETLRAV